MLQSTRATASQPPFSAGETLFRAGSGQSAGRGAAGRPKQALRQARAPPKFIRPGRSTTFHPYPAQPVICFCQVSKSTLSPRLTSTTRVQFLSLRALLSLSLSRRHPPSSSRCFRSSRLVLRPVSPGVFEQIRRGSLLSVPLAGAASCLFSQAPAAVSGPPTVVRLSFFSPFAIVYLHPALCSCRCGWHCLSCRLRTFFPPGNSPHLAETSFFPFSRVVFSSSQPLYPFPVLRLCATTLNVLLGLWDILRRHCERHTTRHSSGGHYLAPVAPPPVRPTLLPRYAPTRISHVLKTTLATSTP